MSQSAARTIRLHPAGDVVIACRRPERCAAWSAD